MGLGKKWEIRKGQEDTKLNKAEFTKRYQRSFYDPQFDKSRVEVARLTEIAWKNYEDHRKAPVTVKAGPGFADPDYDLSVEWLETRNKMMEAQKKHATSRTRILVICGSPRNEHTCPGEVSKTHRLAERARHTLRQQDELEIDFLDLSLLTAEYGKNIHPCKACVSTAMPLCHWPCSCYPNHSLGQETDWMNEIYERWVHAHGIMILTPVHWYGLPSVLKLMVDRLVCADGGNPDPTSTHGKQAAEAKEIEMKGWGFPKHLAGRAFSLVVHGDTNGVDNVRRNLADWLTDMGLVPSGRSGSVGRYIGYYGPYATSHDELDKYEALFKEVDNAALSLLHQVELVRSGKTVQPDQDLKDPEQK
jgi:multimeric flavodoxin WrbA